MKILVADYIVTFSDDFKIIKDGAICFDGKIIDMGKREDVIKNNPYAVVKYLSKNSVILPGLINTHLHLEFSANKTSLIYGDFVKWLQSVIKNREELSKACNNICFKEAIEDMLQSGVLAFGAVSSFGQDLEACFEAPQRVVYFNEILGSNPDQVNEIIVNFEKRFKRSIELSSEFLTPALFVHSAYSTHPILTKYIINLAKKNDLLISAHYMESKSEREWLYEGSGKFYSFLSQFGKAVKPMYYKSSFLEEFKGLDTLFVHANLCDESELKFISENGSLSHCVVSNRLLGNPMLDLKIVEKYDINLTLGTDGLSSNTSLNLWDEMRAFIFSHQEEELLKASKTAFEAVTKNAAKALRLDDNGTLEIGKNADIITLVLPQKVEDEEQLLLEMILHTKNIKSAYIAGERCV